MDEELSGEEKKAFRSCAAKLNYLGLDRPDIQFATKMVCQAMTNPTVAAKNMVKRIARYLVGAKELVE